MVEEEVEVVTVGSKIGADLIERAVNGDQTAFEEIVRRTYSDMYGLALRLLGDEDDARDVLQEAYLRVHRSLAGFRGDAAFETWLYRITANAAYTFLRKRKRSRTESLDSIEEPESTSPEPEEVSQSSHLREVLEHHLMALPVPQRTVVVMKDVYGLSHEAIAAELGITVTAAKVRLHRARRRLRAALEADGEIDGVTGRERGDADALS
ncbi:MAG: sigma-70 family RNA polymerase sigma factor [Acidimicrobiia bacterium]|nr:sigma-70 family RNA polymerase sigma factor [Acidimicrobiia bacterium]